jgi:hypothetical protein
VCTADEFRRSVKPVPFGDSATAHDVDKQRFGPWALVTGASSGISRAVAARRLSILDEVGQDLPSAVGTSTNEPSTTWISIQRT